jgi:tRNA threonylcarbamoyladenosine biosynthesis protein TsaB
VRVLGIETSSALGSVALLENGATICSLEHRRENAHGESILPMIEQALARAGWNRRQLDRIAVGIGPGSFTGLRVGIALAEGLCEGLGIPLVGIPSPIAVATALPGERPGCRCVLLDARKGEAFLAAYHADGREALPVRLVASRSAVEQLTFAFSDRIFIGNGTALFPDLAGVFRSPETDHPHARWTALSALGAEPEPTVRPLYVRDAGALVPRLPDNPLRAPRSG